MPMRGRAADGRARREAALYHRLGGYDTLAAFVDSWFRMISADRRLRGYFRGFSTQTYRKTRQLTVEFIADWAGGPVFYTGRAMRAAHGGLRITDADFDRMVDHAAAALNEAGVTDPERSEVLAFLAGFRGEVVERG